MNSLEVSSCNRSNNMKKIVIFTSNDLFMLMKNKRSFIIVTINAYNSLDTSFFAYEDPKREE